MKERFFYYFYARRDNSVGVALGRRFGASADRWPGKQWGAREFRHIADAVARGREEFPGEFSISRVGIAVLWARGVWERVMGY